MLCKITAAIKKAVVRVVKNSKWTLYHSKASFMSFNTLVNVYF